MYSNDINPNYINQPKKRMTSASPGAERRKILKSSGGLHQNTASRLTLRRSVCCCWSSLLFSLPLLLCTQCVQVKTLQTVRRAELPCRSHNDLKTSNPNTNGILQCKPATAFYNKLNYVENSGFKPYRSNLKVELREPTMTLQHPPDIITNNPHVYQHIYSSSGGREERALWREDC